MVKKVMPKGTGESYKDTSGDRSDVIKVNPEYTRTIKKIASYSGVVRTMEMGNDGKFKEIINIYVYPEGIVDNYPDKVADRYTDENSISKQAVRDHGQKKLAIWGRNDPYGASTPRRKKHSKPVKRKMLTKKHH